MIKIFLITPFVPSTIGAGVNYTRQFIEDLSSENKVDIVLFKKPGESYIPPNANVRLLREFEISFWKKVCNVCLLFFLFPLFTAKFNVLVYAYVRRVLKREDYDVVYFDFSQMFLYAKFVNHKNKILMSHDVITQRFSRTGNRLITRFCYWTEKFVLHASNAHIFTFSEKDSKLLSSLFHIQSTPTSFYLSDSVKRATSTEIGDYFVFFAMWKRNDNSNGLNWFLSEVYPYCQGFQFKIIGAGLDEQIQKRLTPLSNIEYCGFVDNPYPIIANAKALISPLFTGAGVKVKVIDALACGTPVIGTAISFEGISLEYSDFMLVAEDVQSFVRQMNMVDISMEKRNSFKSHFISTYADKAVMRFIHTIG